MNQLHPGKPARVFNACQHDRKWRAFTECGSHGRDCDLWLCADCGQEV